MFESGTSKSFSIFPIRIVYMPLEEAKQPASILISVSKRKFKRAVRRNRVKRQIREAYRRNKHLLTDELLRRGQCLRSEEHTSELQSRQYLVCRLLLEKKKQYTPII